MLFAVLNSAAIAILVVTLIGSCSHVPKLIPHVARTELKEQIRKATLVVVGHAESERAVRTLVSEPKEGSMPLQLRAVRIAVEGVLEGHFGSEQLTFYYYQTTGAWDGPPINIVGPGRSIFYLVNDQGVLRATTDVYLSHTRLVTGKHNVLSVSGKEQVLSAIGRLLLEPGEGLKLEGSLNSWSHSVAVALSLIPQTQVVQILQKYLQSPNHEARGRVCILLAEFPLNEKGCLSGIISDPQILPEDRRLAQKLVR